MTRNQKLVRKSQKIGFYADRHQFSQNDKKGIPLPLYTPSFKLELTENTACKIVYY